MGKRSRRDLANSALRQAHRVINHQNDLDWQTSQLVYNQLQEWNGDQLGKEVWVLVSIAATQIAPGVLAAAELPATEENAALVVALLTAKFWMIATSVTAEDLESYRVSEAAVAARGKLSL